MEDWNEWSKKNQNNKKYKAKKYKPQVQVLAAEETQGGIEAMRFMHMYRNNQRGEIGPEIDLFKEFFNRKDSIEKPVFYRLAAVWIKRTHFFQKTGRKWKDQDHVVKTYKRQNARKFANEELSQLPIELLYDEFDLIFPEKS